MHFDIATARIAVTTPDHDTLMADLETRMRAEQGFALATINLDHLVKLGRDAGFRDAYQRQDIVVADGNPIVWLSRIARRPVALIPGSDLIAPLAELAARTGTPVALFGSRPEVLERAAMQLEACFPGLVVTARIAPPMGFDPTGPAAERLLADLSESGARLCLLALGAPKQEQFAAFGRSRAPKIGFVSIGAGLDFIAGQQTRAPRLVRALALEWLWRLMSDPGRLAARYWLCFMILPGQIRAALRLRRAAR
ncbi:MAG: glycosyltransferase [Rhodobacteraceae bacterium]|nr:MAG: glycosyltransferase [Paracoccaceae bacterium]